MLTGRGERSCGFIDCQGNAQSRLKAFVLTFATSAPRATKVYPTQVGRESVLQPALFRKSPRQLCFLCSWTRVSVWVTSTRSFYSEQSYQSVLAKEKAEATPHEDYITAGRRFLNLQSCALRVMKQSLDEAETHFKCLNIFYIPIRCWRPLENPSFSLGVSEVPGGGHRKELDPDEKQGTASASVHRGAQEHLQRQSLHWSLVRDCGVPHRKVRTLCSRQSTMGLWQPGCHAGIRERKQHRTAEDRAGGARGAGASLDLL